MGLSSLWKIHTQPHQPGTSSSCWSPVLSHTAVRWHPILQPPFCTTRAVWLCWPLSHKEHVQTDPTSSVKLRSGVPAGHSIFSTPKFWRSFLIKPTLWRQVPESLSTGFNCGDVGVPLVVESHLHISMHSDCFQRLQTLFF